MNSSKIKQLASSKGLEILEESVQLNESGVDFLVAHAKDTNHNQWILRLPRRPESMRSALIEKKSLELLKRYADFQVPDWIIFSDELIAYPQLEGIPAATVDAENQRYIWSFDETAIPPNFYRTLGETLANLHSLPQEEFIQLGIKSTPASELRVSMKQRMENVKALYDINPVLWERWQAWLAKDSYWPSFVGVRHGDVHPGHILIDQQHQVTGLIDWTEIAIGDVSADFLAHYLLFGKDGLDQLIEAYETAGGKTWPKMAEHVVELLTTSGITVAEYAQASGLEDMTEAAKQMLASEP